MRKITTLLALMITIGSFAQSPNGSIKGTVKDQLNQAMPAATVSLLKAADSSVQKIAVANKAGVYEFEGVPNGKYLISASAVGHQKTFSLIVTITADKTVTDLGIIKLPETEKSMTGVVITAKKPLVEQKIDRTIINVEASATNVGASALEVLEKSPGISVDKDGNVSLKGKQGVMVLVDGRPTQLGGADLANLLRSMSSNQLDQIEIMTNPPAKYDAAGNAGVINIKTKKSKQFGYNGSVTLGYSQGNHAKYNEAFNFNYRKGKVNLFTNLSHNSRNNRNNMDLTRKFVDRSSKELTSVFEQQARMSNKGNFYSGKVGMDFFASKNTTFGVVLNGFVGPGTFENRNLNNIFNPQRELINVTKAFSFQDENWKNLSGNFNFRRVLDTTGKELTADFDVMSYGKTSKQMLTNSYFDALGGKTQKSDTLFGSLPQDIKIYSGKMDYVHPLKNDARFEAGIKTSFVKTDNNSSYDTADNGAIVHDVSRSNYFIYEENINAAYVNISGPISKKFTGQLGLRVENTNAKGRQVTTDENFDRHYTQLFPTAYLQYKASEKNSFVLNYGRRIRRPDYESLNPFVDYLDRYTYQLGNPNLKPQFSHNIELSHTYGRILTTTLNYTRTTDIIQQVIAQNEEKNETYVTKANLARQRQYGIAVSANFPITKWWSTNLYANAFNSLFEGIVNNDPVLLTSNMLMINGTHQFKLNKTLSAEVSGWYRTAGAEGVIRTEPMGVLSLGFSKQIMKGNGTLRLNVRDLFHSQEFRASSKYGTVDATFHESRDSRMVNIGFTWRFNKGKMEGSHKKKANSASEEQNRVGVGN